MFSLVTGFRTVAFLEGVSYILLLFFASPYKYITTDDTYVRLLGMPHGVLFMGYIILAIIIGRQFKWDTKTQLLVLAASIIPFGTFYIDNKYLKPK